MALEAVCKELLSKGLINGKQFTDIKASADDGSFVERLLEREYISFDILASVLKQAFFIDYISIAEGLENQELAKMLLHSEALRHKMIPLGKSNGVILLAMAEPFDYAALENAESAFGCPAKAVFASPEDVKYHINKLYGAESMGNIVNQFMEEESRERIVRSRYDFTDSPVNRIVKSLIDTAILLNASDIHIEPYEDSLRVRLRIDGRLEEYKSLEPELLPPILSIIKIKGGMDPYISMTPQSGHAKYEETGSKIDLRFSTVPTINGEKIAIRLLYGASGLFTKERLGFFSADLEKLSHLFTYSHGAILVTGPTGSGKSTTLYSFISELNVSDVNIVTIEDPVENVVFGVNQINVNTKAELGFASVLRSVLRQDPDIIMVGEIRDSETAGIAIRAALTGHVVLATLHTNDALSAIVRLIDMGVDRFTVAHAVKGVISQRLVRRICPHCKTEDSVSEKDALMLGIPKDLTAYRGRGCAKCNNTGYSGRLAVYEYFVFDYAIRSMVEEGCPYEQLAEYLAAIMEPLRANVLENVRLGNTTVKEMYRVVF